MSSHIRTMKRKVARAKGLPYKTRRPLYRPDPPASSPWWRSLMLWLRMQKYRFDIWVARLKAKSTRAMAMRKTGRERAAYLLDKGIFAVPSWLKSRKEQIDWVFYSKPTSFWA